MKRSYLFLQGVCSPFFARLADSLEREGHTVFKVNFNCGDAVYWRGRNVFSFRGQLTELREFLDSIYRKYSITDQILFGDRRPVHRPAVEHAEKFGIRTHVFEEGYFRPYWITLEREGVNGHSLLPRDPEWFWAVGGDLYETEKFHTFSSSFAYRMLHDVTYHVVGAANLFLFSNYRTHAPVNAAIEYAAYLRRFVMLSRLKKIDDACIDSLLQSGRNYFVLPLQLNSDAQIRDHSRFNDMSGVMNYVMESFARHAPPNASLVIKNHPLDMRLHDYPYEISILCRQYGLEGRVYYLESGNLDQLVLNAQGVVTVNSTVGSFSLSLNCPTITLSDPIYNLPGLTFQGSIDDFWKKPEPPNSEMFRRFRNTVMYATQVNGGFYCKHGIDLAVDGAVKTLISDRSPLESLQ